MDIKTNKSSSFDTIIRFVSADDAVNIIDFEGKEGEQVVRYEDRKAIIYVAKESLISTPLLKDAVANAIRVVSNLKRSELSIELSDAKDAAAVTEAAILGNYLFQDHKSEKKTMVETVELVGKGIDDSAVETAKVIGTAVCYSRDLQNANAVKTTPEFLAQEALSIGASCDTMSVEVLTEKEIVEKGLGLLWAVGQGSATPPRLMIINYNGDPKSEKRTAVVGKGLTFDTGGYNLKPTGSIESMRMDMSGGAATLGVMKAIAKIQPKINVVAVVPSAQSAIGKDAFLPGDVYTSYSGKTVEVLNTDAEGRLILADALSYTIEHYKPTEILDIATLTGAVLVALGDTMAGTFSNDCEMAKRVYNAGETCGEPVWELPIKKEHREAMKSDIADLQNISKIKRNASSITAAAFLENFVEDTPWVHIDIAGTAHNSNANRGVFPKGGTAFGVRLILSYLGLNK